MPTPRLVSCPDQAGSGAVMSAVDTDSSSLSGLTCVSGEISGDQDAAQQQPALAADINSSLVLLSISSSMIEDAVTTGHPDELQAACTDGGSMQEAGWQSSGPAILVSNDLFQQLPDGSMAAQQLNQWQANDIFETQTSIAESNCAGECMSAPSDQYSSLLINSSSSGHSSCWLAESAYCTQSGTLERAEEHYSLDDVHQSSRMMPGSASQQSNSRQQQAFSVLFDTQLSQIVTTQEDLFGSSAELPAHNAPEAASALCNTRGPVQQAQQVVSLCSSQLSDAEPAAEPTTAHSSSSTSDSVSDSTLISMHSAVAGESCTASAQQDSITAAVADITAGSAASAADKTAAVESCEAAPSCTKHLEGQQEPLTAAVSTAQLEVMGWDLFADTLGTFRLLSDSNSDADSTVSLLPEPCELGPITPEVADHQLKLNQGRYREDAPAMVCATEASACLDACQSQGQAQLELIGNTVLTAPADTSVLVNHFPCLEQEYQTMLADRQSLVMGYPGMSSDAEEFDGPGTGCLGQCTSCTAGVEQCVTCNPCATCACHPYAALRPGKRHQKSRCKRIWARLCRTGAGAACLRPKFEHERLADT